MQRQASKLFLRPCSPPSLLLLALPGRVIEFKTGPQRPPPPLRGFPLPRYTEGALTVFSSLLRLSGWNYRSGIFVTRDEMRWLLNRTTVDESWWLMIYMYVFHIQAMNGIIRRKAKEALFLTATFLAQNWLLLHFLYYDKKGRKFKMVMGQQPKFWETESVHQFYPLFGPPWLQVNYPGHYCFAWYVSQTWMDCRSLQLILKVYQYLIKSTFPASLWHEAFIWSGQPCRVKSQVTKSHPNTNRMKLFSACNSVVPQLILLKLTRHIATISAKYKERFRES